MASLTRLRQIYTCTIFLPFLNDGFNRTLGDAQWLGNVFVSIPWLILFNNLLTELLEVCLCLHGVIVARTRPSDTGVFILQSVDTHSLSSDDHHFTKWETTSTNWLDLCWIWSVTFKGVNINAIFYFINYWHYFIFHFTSKNVLHIFCILTMITFIKAITGKKIQWGEYFL